MSELNLTHKIIILAFISRASTPVSNTHITVFFLDNQISDYFTLQQTIHSLSDDDLISVIQSHGSTLYRLTGEGEKILSLFSDRLTREIADDIRDYYFLHSDEIKSDSAVMSYYEKDRPMGYVCHLSLSEGNTRIAAIDLHVFNEDQAKSICTNWEPRSQAVYDTLIDILES